MRIDCYGDRADGAARMAGVAREPHGTKKAGGATYLRFGARSPAPIHRLSVDADGIVSREWAWGGVGGREVARLRAARRDFGGPGMRIVIFDQWEKLVSLLKGMAASSATERTQYAINRVEAKDGIARLTDRAANNLALVGGATTVVMPNIVPGKARDLMLRVTASGENEIAFAGAEAFEGDEGALEPPGDGETVVYFFTETAADVMLVARKSVGRLET